MPLTPIKISVFYYKHDGHIPQNFYYADDIDEIWGLGENEYPGLTKVQTIPTYLCMKIGRE